MQSKLKSLVETSANIIIGFAVSMILTAIVLPYYGHDVSLSHNFEITLIFTVASFARGYFVRRFFNRVEK